VKVPGLVASVSVIDVPIHNTVGPAIAAGGGNTEITLNVRQPYGDVKYIVSIPGVRPLTTPPGDTVAIAVLLELHVPVPEFDNNVTEPTHTLGAPVIAAGVGSTVTVNIAQQPEYVYV